MTNIAISLADIAEQIGAELVASNGQPILSLMVSGIGALDDATASQISFLANPSYRKQLALTKAAAVIIHPDMLDECPVAALVMQNPYMGFAKLSQLFDNLPKQAVGIHPTAIIADTAEIADGVSIAANVVIADHVQIGADTRIGPGCVINEHSIIGKNTLLHANIVIYHDVIIGDDCIVHAGCVLGADGFGFAPDAGRWVKIAQLGGVRIGNNVEIGANTTIDRGALGNTEIGNGVKLDDQIMIAHNVIIGDDCAIAGTVGIAGSSKLGKRCTLAGGVGIAGHLELTDDVHVTGMTMITKSVTEAGAYSSGTAMMPLKEWRKSATRFRQLDDMARRLKKLEKNQ
ncbi:UDP-3-O-(3-hydroxymyristoyl)glucosamine N-acyltransferase [Oleispira antarctica]|uniref:UDP-3-O-acylglucosamine N-acyltransferase n=1 Tax=Oleispira antarctica TaxID=188908 RepID=A0A1Y5HVP9_OLEAN|nr:UDP-3-O-(3-hydroxymyristoyl)glucosamine N-acyltransferase [Oleispira antarctica]